MYYILGGLLDGIGSACMSCCREFEGYRSVAGFGKKAREIKRNDVAHLRHLYSISSPQTAGPGCRDERLSGGQERRSWVRRKMASRLSNAWKRNPSHTPSSVLGSGRTYKSPVTLDSRARSQKFSTPQRTPRWLFQSRYGWVPDSPAVV